MANIISVNYQGDLVVDRARPVPRATELRRDSVYQYNVMGGRLHPDLVAVLTRLQNRDTGTAIDWEWIDRNMASSRGDVLRIMCGVRTPEEQADVYAQGRTAPGNVVTYAKPYASYHQWGLAVDLVWTRYGYEAAIVGGEAIRFDRAEGWLRTGLPQFLETAGLEWGGRWSDLEDVGHFQLVRKVPADDAFCGSPWWSMGDVNLVDLGRRGKTGGQPWVVVAALAGGYLLMNRKG